MFGMGRQEPGTVGKGREGVRGARAGEVGITPLPRMEGAMNEVRLRAGGMPAGVVRCLYELGLGQPHERENHTRDTL